MCCYIDIMHYYVHSMFNNDGNYTFLNNPFKNFSNLVIALNICM